MTKDQLTKLRHTLIRAAELATQSYQLVNEVIREILKEEESLAKPVSPGITTSGDGLQQVTTSGFKPSSKTKGDPLQEFASSLSNEDREKLIAKLGGK